MARGTRYKGTSTQGSILMIEATVLLEGRTLDQGQIVLVPEGAIAAMDAEGMIPVLDTNGQGHWASWSGLRLHIDKNLSTAWSKL